MEGSNFGERYERGEGNEVGEERYSKPPPFLRRCFWPGRLDGLSDRGRATDELARDENWAHGSFKLIRCGFAAHPPQVRILVMGRRIAGASGAPRCGHEASPCTSGTRFCLSMNRKTNRQTSSAAKATGYGGLWDRTMVTKASRCYGDGRSFRS